MGGAKREGKLPVADGRDCLLADDGKKAAGAGGSLKRRNPGLQARASGNEINFQEEIVMTNTTTAVSNVIQFRFDKKEVRTLLIDGQPWFVAVDVCNSLSIVNPTRALSRLDDDEKALHSMKGSRSVQEFNVINESGLYSLILTSRKDDARRFKKWITSEVLPAIRKQGQYVDSSAKMQSLVEGLIGVTELTVIKGLIRQKGSALQAGLQRSIGAKTYSALHTRFNVARTELIPHKDFAEACNFIAAYQVHEGEYLEKETPATARLNIHYPVAALTARRPEMLTIRNSEQAWLDVSMHDLCSRPQDISLCEEILCELRDNGYDIEGAWFEVRSLRNRLGELNSFLTGLGVAIQHPTRYAVDLGDAA